MNSFWIWVGSPSYWKLAAMFTGVYWTLVVLGKTGDWSFTATTGLALFFCWLFGTRSKENT